MSTGRKTTEEEMDVDHQSQPDEGESQPRRSGRTVKLTDKARVGKLQDSEKKFEFAYGKLIEFLSVKRTLTELSPEETQQLLDNLSDRKTELVDLFEHIREFSLDNVDPDIVKAIDRACAVVERNIKTLERHIKKAAGDRQSDIMSLGSLFTERTRASKGSQGKRQETAVKVAALAAELASREEEAEEEDELDRIEREEEKRRADAEAEIQRRRRQLETKRLEKSLRVEQAKLEAYDHEGSELQSLSSRRSSRRRSDARREPELILPTPLRSSDEPAPVEVLSIRSPILSNHSRHPANDRASPVAALPITPASYHTNDRASPIAASPITPASYHTNDRASPIAASPITPASYHTNDRASPIAASPITSASHHTSDRASPVAASPIMPVSHHTNDRMQPVATSSHHLDYSVAAVYMPPRPANSPVHAPAAQLQDSHRSLYQASAENRTTAERIASEKKPFSSPLQPNATPFYPSSPGNDDIKQLSQALIASVALNRLPVPEPSIFTGDPMEYPDWNASFTALVESHVHIQPQEKIYYLKRYIAGEAKKAVSGYFLLKTETAYQKARKILQERFGDPFTISDHFRKRLANWPRVEDYDGDGLRKLADFLSQCEAAMLEIKELSILNDPQETKKILRHLPDYIIKTWNRRVARHKRENGSYPDFAAFVAFINEEAEIACDPVTSLSSIRPKKESNKNQNERQKRRGPGASTFATETQAAEASKLSCLLCKKPNHSLHSCRTFSSKTADEKRDFVKSNNLCFGCLSPGHMSKDCKNRSTCKKCNSKHPTCLHEGRREGNYANGDGRGNNTNARNVQTDKKPRTETKSGVCNAGSSREPISSMVVPVWISTSTQPESECLVYALLDTQSDTTFVVSHVAERLQSVTQESTKLRLTTMTSKDVLINCHRYKDLVIRGYNSDIRIPLPTTYSRDHIPLDESHIPTPETAERWPHLREVASKIQPLLDCEVGLLIGYNCPQALAPRRCITGVGNEPFAMCTDLGWSVVGCASLTDDSGDAIGLTNLTICQRVNENLVTKHDHPEVKFVFKTSVEEQHPLGTMESIHKTLEADFSERKLDDSVVSQDDLHFIKTIKDGIQQQDDGHLSMPLPFKGDRPELPNNRFAASRRLETLRRRMTRDDTYRGHYTAFIQEILNRGDAEVVPKDEETPATVWYIPHHGVYHPQKKDKIRVVFDCSAKFRGTSLNDHLLPGPDLINPLIGVLCRFRQEPIAIMCDIEKMFHQFRVHAAHRNYLRFLWWEGGDLEKDPIDHRMKVHLFGAVSSPGCANFGLKEIARRYRHINEEASDFIERDFYVDDGLKSTATSEQGIRLLQDAIKICKKGNLRLHKIVSNSPKVLEAIPATERASTSQDLSLSFEDAAPERALGIQWCIELDQFCFKLTLKDLPVTRRGILATVASVYDPIGFLAPFVLRGKLILQEICKEGSAWDDPVSEEVRTKWEKWRLELLSLKDVRIPRCYKPADFGNPTTVELHHFSDASTEGYGQCSFIRLKNADGKVSCSFVMGKARIAPRKPVTIPRLELQAAVTSVRISNLLNVELDYPSIENHFWTDSKIVLGYIQNDARRFHVYVANRIQRIRESSEPSQWRYVSTHENPADHASRGLGAEEITTSTWLKGPSFLWEQDIPLESEEHEIPVDDPEVKRTVTLATCASTASGLEDRLEKFSSWTAAVKGLTALRRLARRKSGKTVHSPVEETRATELEIISWVQRSAFADEVQALKRGSLPSRLKTLDPILHDGILRVGGRLANSSLDVDTRQPIILPRKSYATTLLARHLHEAVAHQGRGITLNHIRSSGYWILGGTSVVSSIIFKCFHCRKMRGTPTTPKMANLPKERAEPSPPFTTCGMDCFGPFLVKEGRKEHKRYGVIFTCLALRAIHVEVLDDMTTDALINGLRCLFAIRGRVRLIRCDQGSNFIGARQELKQALSEIDNDKLQSWLLENRCDFQFNPPSASHMGGVWERQIRSVRTVLDGLLKDATSRLDTSALRTLMYEAMAIVNGRPLTVENINDPSSPAPLTPNHLLTMKSAIVPPAPGKFVQEDVYARKRWRKVQHLANEFWQRWRKEYLAILQSRKKWQEDRRNLQVGDVVILKEENLVRGQWTLARVKEVLPSADNVVRKGPLPVKWMAIESLVYRTFSTKSDVWSFGVLLWELFTLGANPYPGLELNETFIDKLRDGYRMDRPEFGPPEVNSTMRECWQNEPEDRPNFSELAERLGSLLENKVKTHYIDLNTPYLVLQDEAAAASVTPPPPSGYLQMNSNGYMMMKSSSRSPNDRDTAIELEDISLESEDKMSDVDDGYIKPRRRNHEVDIGDEMEMKPMLSTMERSDSNSDKRDKNVKDLRVDLVDGKAIKTTAVVHGMPQKSPTGSSSSYTSQSSQDDGYLVPNTSQTAAPNSRRLGNSLKSTGSATSETSSGFHSDYVNDDYLPPEYNHAIQGYSVEVV